LLKEENENILDDIFNKILTGKKIIIDPTVLNNDYIPNYLPFREKQITSIGQSLALILKGNKSSNLLLYGKTGTGKTVVARYITEKLIERVNNINLIVAYSNTRISNTGYRILLDLANAINLDIPFTGLSIGEVLKRLSDHISKEKYFIILILDEIDYFTKTHGDNLLYDLTRSNENLHPGFLSIIGISNDLNFKEYLNPRVLSSLGEEEIVFPPYTAIEIKSILEKRADIAFENGAISQAAISLCSALAGSEHGDARRAVDLLRIAAEVAEREEANKVEEKHVRIAVQRIERDRNYDALISLPLQQKIILISILKSNSNCTTGDVYQNYRDICKKIGIEILTQRRISGILSELDLLGLITANVVNHGRYGRTKKIRNLVSSQIIREAFKEDQTLSNLL
jgi:cell division control protein 6